MVLSDEKKLLNGNGYTRSYDSTLNKEHVLIYCMHGNIAEKCCSVNTKEKKEHLMNGKFTRSFSGLYCHDCNRQKVDSMARKRLIFASCFCLAFMIGEAVGGIIANSLAIATDAAHLLTDFAGFIISLASLYISARPPTKRMTFGWYRAEVLGALTSVLLIWAVTAVLVYMAVLRLQTRNFEVDGAVMLITASVGVSFNLIMGFVLQFGCVPRADDGSSESIASDSGSSAKDTQNINVRAAFIHVIGDLIQSIGVLAAAFIIYFKPEYAIVDPICTFLFSILVLITTITILRDVLNVLMEGAPSGVDKKKVSDLLLKVPGVTKVHNLRIWLLSMDKTAISAHIVIAKDASPFEILRTGSNIIQENYDIYDLTLQIEDYKLHGMPNKCDCGEYEAI